MEPALIRWLYLCRLERDWLGGCYCRMGMQPHWPTGSCPGHRTNPTVVSDQDNSRSGIRRLRWHPPALATRGVAQSQSTTTPSMQLSDGGCPFHRAVRRREASKRTFELSGSGGDGKTPLRYRAFLVSRVRTFSGRAAVRWNRCWAALKVKRE